jgi:peroxiredoxin Q/BCP
MVLHRFVPIGLLAACVTVGVAAKGSGQVSPRQLEPGDPAPPFSLVGSNGKTYRLGDLRGKVLVLAWFAKAFTAG